MAIQERNEEAQIRQLIERWAQAVGKRDINGALADHARDILMFDVPPPNEVRGIEAYRETWQPSFDALGASGVFEIVALEVTPGDRVAFATALLRCGTEEELSQKPGIRLRLTIGLRKEGDRWTVAHEHHSFPLESAQ